MVASCRSCLEPKCAWRPLLLIPIAVASPPIESPSSPSTVASRAASARIAVLVRWPFVFSSVTAYTLLSIKERSCYSPIPVDSTIVLFSGCRIECDSSTSRRWPQVRTYSHYSVIAARQAPLRRLYADDPREALTTQDGPNVGGPDTGERSVARPGRDRRRARHVAALRARSARRRPARCADPGRSAVAALAACADGAIRMFADLLAVSSPRSKWRSVVSSTSANYWSKS